MRSGGRFCTHRFELRSLKTNHVSGERGTGVSKSVYVGNLNYSTTQDGLYELFETYGEVTSVNIITDRETGRARGFAFVEMATQDAADAAIAALDGQQADGRTLKVNEARPRRPRGDRGGDRNRGRW